MGGPVISIDYLVVLVGLGFFLTLFIERLVVIFLCSILSKSNTRSLLSLQRKIASTCRKQGSSIRTRSPSENVGDAGTSIFVSFSIILFGTGVGRPPKLTIWFTPRVERMGSQLSSTLSK